MQQLNKIILNTELFIARRLFFDKKTNTGISRPIISIAIIGIALGLAVMIISVCVVTGFKNQIRDKIIGFNSHIQIVNFDNNSSYETNPINKNQIFISEINEINDISSIQVYAIKAGIIQTKTDIHGVVLKGIGSDYKWDFFKENLIDGNIFIVNDTLKTNKALISKYLSSLLKLKVGDKFRTYFIDNTPRRFIVEGIYETGLMEFDNNYILVDIGHVQKLNKWDANRVTGFELEIDRFKNLDVITELVADITSYNFSEDKTLLRTTNIKEKFVHIFDWLNLQDINVWIILILMLIVSGFNMVSGLLILILERTNMIGIMKALGFENVNIRKIFLYLSGLLISKGLLWGNIIGIGICIVQDHFKIFKLDQASYFFDTVPINFSILLVIALNIGTLLLTLLFLIVPSYIISNISPDKAIRFE